MENAKTKNLEIAGEVSIEVVTDSIPENPFIYIIMGPIGAGKSSFIEALAGDSQTLSISKNQLASVTQTVTAYRLVNISQGGRPVFVVDTPGFSDPKISEFETIDMVKNWMEKHDLLVIDRILFLTPITETRLAGSRRRTIEMLKALLILEEDTESMIFVTTMWDTLHNERTRQRAESNFTQLRDEICAEFADGIKIPIEQFLNNRTSALQAMGGGRFPTGAFYRPRYSVFPHIYQDLHERIEGALLRRQNLILDLAQPDAQTDPELKSILEKNLRDNGEMLTKFIAQWDEFIYLPEGFDSAHHNLQQSIDAMQFETRLTVPHRHAVVAYSPDEPATSLADQPAVARDLSSVTPHVNEVPDRPTTAPFDDRIDIRCVITRDVRLSPPLDDSVPQNTNTGINQHRPSRILNLKMSLIRFFRSVQRLRRKWLKKTKV